MLKQNKSLKIIRFSKEIRSLPDSHSTKHLLPIIDVDVAYPRVFPNNKMPLMVALTRRIKAYEEFNLTEALKGIDWKKDKGFLDLMHFNF